ncbi:MAG: PAP/fibrillin family protein [Crocosphaera sp.]|nr:PAP/fibrillin family protein [Crocosphaera sp.]
MLWKQVFNQDKVEKKGLKETFMSFMLKMILGLVPPKGMNEETGDIFFEIKRSPKGKLKILYLDEEIRITVGEKGTILVCERSMCS